MMKRRNRVSKWVALAVTGVGGIGLVAMVVAMMAVTGVSLVTPDTAFAKFDVKSLTVGGDLRVRGEFRRGSTWGKTKANQQFVHQRSRLRFNYDIHPEVKMFLELQDSRNWGSNDVDNDSRIGGSATSGVTANAGSTAPTAGSPGNLGRNQNNVHGEGLGVREAYIHFSPIKNLWVKLGRQKVVHGNQRLLGHFDWNNVGFSLDGGRWTYSSKFGSHELGVWRLDEHNCANIDSGGCGVSSGGAAFDTNLITFYNTIKGVLPGGTIEPYWYYLLDSRTHGKGNVGVTGTGTATAAATTLTGRVAPDQKRHFFGMRVNGKTYKKMVDYTVEAVWQTGQQKNAANVQQTINAWQAAVKGGVTMPVPMKPRIGFEFDYASGSDNRDGSGGRHTAEGLFPTNHLHYGYMDRAAWKNIVDYQGNFKVHPTKTSNVKMAFHVLRLANTKDNWYTAGQGTGGGGVTNTTFNQAASLGSELDVVYTQKFKDGKLGLQIGYGHFFSGEYNQRAKQGRGGNCTTSGASCIPGNSNDDQDWGYVSLSTKF